MATQFKLGSINVDVVFKKIKNIHLSVYPPAGRVRIAAPARMSLERVRIFAISKLAWIKKQQKRIQEQPREAPREYLDRESHFVWGKRYLLQLVEADQAASVELAHRWMVLTVRPKTNLAKRRAIVDAWYREQVKQTLPGLIAKWEPLMGVKVKRFYVRHMKTRWGSCTPARQSIRLNTDLCKKPPECLEYVVVHEMVHLLEPSHNQRFKALMDQFLPNWKVSQQRLNALPVSHEDWKL